MEGKRKEKEEIHSPNIFKCILTNDSNAKAAEPAVFKLILVVQHMKFNPCLCGKKKSVHSHARLQMSWNYSKMADFI